MARKDIFKSVRLTEDEMKRLRYEAGARGMKVSDYMRMRLFERHSDKPEFQKMISSLTFELNKIGTNINQIAYRSNAGILSENDKLYLKEMMIDAQNILLEIVKHGNSYT